MQDPGVGRMPGPEEVSGVLREILAGPDFAAFDEGARWLLLRRLGELLADLWRWMLLQLGERSWAAEIATVLIVAATAAVLVRVTARHAPAWLRRGGDDDGEAPPETPASAREWLKLATDLAGRGEFRPAATALYQGFLLTFEKRGALSFHSSKTPGDYAAEIARADPVTALAGGRFLDSFQNFSFGRDGPTTAGYAGLARLARDAGCRAEGAERTAQAGAAGGIDDTAGDTGDGGRAIGTPEREGGAR